MGLALGSITAVAQTLQFSLSPELQTLNIQMLGTWVGTIQFEGSFDAGTTWFSVQAAVLSVSGQTAGTLQTSTTVNGQWTVSVGGLDTVRCRSSAWTSGTANVTYEVSIGNQSVGAGNTTITQLPVAAALADATTNPTTTTVGGLQFAFNGTTWDRVRTATGTTGVFAVNTEGTKTSYRAAGFLTPGAAPTDVLVVTGSATKTIRVTRIAITIEATAAGIVDVALIRRSTANSGGTSTTATIGKMDTNDAAATAVVTVYTANATTLGTAVATVGALKGGFVTSGTINPLIWEYGQRNTRAMVLRGTSDFLAVNGNGDTLLTGEVWAWEIEFSEE